MPDALPEQGLDADISAMPLSTPEKNGLQIYRNYQRAFETQGIKRFRTEINAEVIDFSDLKRVVNLTSGEDVRTLPIIVCAFADDLLKLALMNTIPTGIPGGRKELFKGFGPLATLSSRLKLAYAFEVFSSDLMQSLDGLRALRNDVAHTWKQDDLATVWAGKRTSTLFPIEQLLAEAMPSYEGQFHGEAAFRMQLIWLLGRMNYEALAFWRAKAERLSPMKALYAGDDKPIWLTKIARICLDASRSILDAKATA